MIEYYFFYYIQYNVIEKYKGAFKCNIWRSLNAYLLALMSDLERGFEVSNVTDVPYFFASVGGSFVEV